MLNGTQARTTAEVHSASRFNSASATCVGLTATGRGAVNTDSCERLLIYDEDKECGVLRLQADTVLAADRPVLGNIDALRDGAREDLGTSGDCAAVR